MSDADRGFFEGHLGHDLGHVRLHTDGTAADAAQSINARAFTVGRNIAFGPQDRPDGSERGRRLLAHELVHVVQQSAAGPRLQRSLTVTGPRDPADPAAALSDAARNSMFNGLMGELCNGFSVDAVGNVIRPVTCENPDALVLGAQPTGCCCLCVLTAPGSNAWTIQVESDQFPETREGPHEFTVPPTGSTTEFGNWTVSGVPARLSPLLVMGHELCGHGALMELNVHPDAGDRETSDVHDPTVKTQNDLALEQGVSPSDLRGLAADAHRGESLVFLTPSEFPFNGTSVAGLPAAERNKITTAARFANTNDLFVDVIGHSDDVGSSAAKLSVSQGRADSVRAELGSLGVPATISNANVGVTSRFTRVQGVSDTQPLTDPDRAKWRRVEIIMTAHPAGTQVPPAATPTRIDPVLPRSIPALIGRGLFGNACERRLTQRAWT